jgi:nucleoside-diphosphate-sugar epimerase
VIASEPVLVTGAFGLVGRAVVRQLLEEGRRVVATDLDVPANRAPAAALRDRKGARVRWADLTKPAEVDALLAAVSPAAIVHLAAVIPPMCYARRALARAVNVDATANLVRAAEALPTPPRFVLASSVAVYGSRNPHRTDDLLSADTPRAPSDLYGGHKAQAEDIVASSRLEWAVLRLGAVMSIDLRLPIDLDLLYFEAVFPADNRIQSVDVRDVARAFSVATTTDAVREVFLVGGDESHRMLAAELAPRMTSALGLHEAVPDGRKGNPDSDSDWFHTDWMDTTRSQQVLSFQHHTWPDILGEARAKTGWKRYPLRLASPFVRGLLEYRSPYRGRPGIYADPWGLIRSKWGEPEPDGLSR